MKCTKFLLSIGLFSLGVETVNGQSFVPPEVAKFVEPNTKAIDLELGDVNGDGRPDYLLVLEGPEESDNARYLLVLVREKNGQLKLAARNNTILGCPLMQGQGGGIVVTPTGAGFRVIGPP